MNQAHGVGGVFEFGKKPGETDADYQARWNAYWSQRRVDEGKKAALLAKWGMK